MTTKTATDLLADLIRYTEGRMSKRELNERWKGHSWQTEELRQWALWNWRNVGL